MPRHARLRLLANCAQQLGKTYGRRLIVMEKVDDGEEGEDGGRKDGAYIERDMLGARMFRDSIIKCQRIEPKTANE